MRRRERRVGHEWPPADSAILPRGTCRQSPKKTPHGRDGLVRDGRAAGYGGGLQWVAPEAHRLLTVARRWRRSLANGRYIIVTAGRSQVTGWSDERLLSQAEPGRMIPLASQRLSKVARTASERVLETIQLSTGT